MFFFLKISYLAYLSTKAECGQIPVCSTDFSGSYSPNSKEITINLPENDKNYYSVLIHEVIHAKQDSEGRLSTCDNYLNVGVFINEFKAYLMEELTNGI
jgi:hypothetical protein